VLGRVEAGGELAAGGDVQLGEDAVQMRADGAGRQVEPLADFPVGQALGGEPGDLHFLRGEDGLRGRSRCVAAFPSGAQFGAGLLAPHVDLVAKGERRRLDEVAKIGGFSIIARGFEPAEKIDTRLLNALAVVGSSYITLGIANDIRGAEDMDGRLEAFLDQHGWAAMIVRPDFYVYGGAADAAGLNHLLRELLTDLESAGVGHPNSYETHTGETKREARSI